MENSTSSTTPVRSTKSSLNPKVPQKFNRFVGQDGAKNAERFAIEEKSQAFIIAPKNLLARIGIPHY